MTTQHAHNTVSLRKIACTIQAISCWTSIKQTSITSCCAILLWELTFDIWDEVMNTSVSLLELFSSLARHKSLNTFRMRFTTVASVQGSWTSLFRSMSKRNMPNLWKKSKSLLKRERNSDNDKLYVDLYNIYYLMC